MLKNNRLNNPNREYKEPKAISILNKAGTAIMLNMLFLLACLPVVTIGPALSGLYSGVRYIIRGDGCAVGFWEGFKTRFLRNMIAGVIITAAVAYAGYNIFAMLIFEELMLVRLILCCLLTAVIMMLGAVLPILNVYVPSSVSRWLQNGVTLCTRAPLELLGTAAALWLPVVLVIWFTMIAFYTALIFVAAYFMVVAFMSTLFLKYHLIRIRDEEMQYQETLEQENA